MSFLNKIEVKAGGEYLQASLPGNLTREEVKKKVDQWHQDAKHDSGHGGYTGTWAEVRGVNFSGKVFNSRAEAEDWLSSHAQKWEAAEAVRYKSNNFKDDVAKQKFTKGLEELVAKNREVKKLQTALEKHEPKYTDNLKKLADAKKGLASKTTLGKQFVSCPNCKSKIASQHVDIEDLHKAEIPDHPWHKDARYGWEKKHLNESGLVHCPACKKPMAAKGAADKIGAAVTKLDEHRNVIRKLRDDIEKAKKEIKDNELKKHTVESETWLIGAWASS